MRQSTNEASNSETNVTGGQYYSDAYGHWHYKDAKWYKDLTGPQTIDGKEGLLHSRRCSG